MLLKLCILPTYRVLWVLRCTFQMCKPPSSNTALLFLFWFVTTEINTIKKSVQKAAMAAKHTPLDTEAM